MTRVLVIGAGPVGLTLAMDLASRGIDVIVVETALARASRQASSAITSPRVRWRSSGDWDWRGRLRDAGLPADYPNDCSYRTTATGTRAVAHPDSLPPRPLYGDRRPRHLVADARAAAPHQPDLSGAHAVRARRGDAAGVASSTAPRSRASAKTRTASSPRRATSTAARPRQIAADYLVGCDGARSLVRKAIGAKLAGTPVIQRVQSTYIRAPQLAGDDAGKPAWMTLSLNPRRCGTVVAIDGRETWLIHNHLNAGEPRLRLGGPRLVDPRHPRRRARVRIRDRSARRTGSAAAWWPTASARAASSSAATPRTCGCPMPATA